MSAEEITTSENYRNLETFQKAQLNKKVGHISLSQSIFNVRVFKPLHVQLNFATYQAGFLMFSLIALLSMLLHIQMRCL